MSTREDREWDADNDRILDSRDSHDLDCDTWLGNYPCSCEVAA